MHLELTPDLRIRSHNEFQVVLERKRMSIPTKKTDVPYEGWFFEGYFTDAGWLLASAKAYTKYFKLYGRLLRRTEAQEHAVQKYWDVFQYINTCNVSAVDIQEFTRKAKEHELEKQKNRKGNTEALEAWHERRKSTKAANE